MKLLILLKRNFENFTVDRFSDDLNKKLSNFNSKYHCPNTSGVNAFTYNWSEHFNWLCPPISMIGDAIKHLKLCHARGVLFVPMWPSSYFWPLLDESNHFNDFVNNYCWIHIFIITPLVNLFSMVLRILNP